MKFSCREAINVPAADVFAAVTDFERFERQSAQYGATIVRLDDQNTIGAGMSWDVGFKFRGRKRQARLTIVEYDDPRLLRIDGKIGGVDSDLIIQVVSVDEHRSRIQVGLDLKPKSLSARLILQSMKLAKTRLTKRFKGRVESFARSIEENYHQDRAA